MKQKTFSVLAVLLAALLWLFTGVDRIVGDHEVGVLYQPFLKHRPDHRLLFENPAWVGLELIPFNKLSVTQQAQLVDYCNVRFGLLDMQQCYRAIQARQI